MGLLKSILKSGVAWDKKYLTRYESSVIAKGAILELSKAHGFKAYQIAQGKEETPIDESSDLSNDFMSCFEIDLTRNSRQFFVGYAPLPTLAYREMTQGKLDRDVYERCFRWNLQQDLFGGHYFSSIDLLKELPQKISWLEERQQTYLNSK